MKIIDMDLWERREHFNFFKNFDEPFFSLVTNVECADAKRFCMENGYSFFLWYLHLSLKAANKTEAFRYRIKDNQAVCYDVISASPTIDRANGIFAFSYIDYYPDFETFRINASREIERVKNTPGLGLDLGNEILNTIHYTTIPWISFTALTHPRNYGDGDSIPKIAFGKYKEENGALLMPVSVTVHHAMMDGFHVGKFLELFQELLNTAHKKM